MDISQREFCYDFLIFFEKSFCVHFFLKFLFYSAVRCRNDVYYLFPKGPYGSFSTRVYFFKGW